MSGDIRWIQRLDSWNRALAQFAKFKARSGDLNELEEQGLIHVFENNHELAWKTQKGFLEESGYVDLFDSKNVVRKAFEVGLIDDGQIWMDMIKSQNLTSHTYNEETTQKIIAAIVDEYYHAFCQLNSKLNELAQQEKQ